MNAELSPKAVLVPPRPNLGPEPLETSSTVEAVLGVVTFVVILVGLSGVVRAARRRRAVWHTPASLQPPAGPFATRRDQMAAWSTAVRAALAARWGSPWYARTTEEIAAAVPLTEELGGDRGAELVQFLAQADLAKFDDREGLQPPLPDPVSALPWLVEFLASTSSEPAAGPSSTIKGK